MAETSRIMDLAAAVRGEVGKAVVGQTGLVDGLLVGLITGGHVLVEGVPGTAKTLARASPGPGRSTPRSSASSSART